MRRQAIFNFYKKQIYILCLQECHSEETDNKIWESEFGGQVFASHGTSSSRGVCILIKKNIPYKVVRQVKDSDGRIIAGEFESTDDPQKRFTLCNIYSPNKDSPQFFIDMLSLTAHLSPQVIYVGDFNLVLDIQKDRKNSDFNYWKAHTVLTEAMEDLYLINLWRMHNPEEQLYTWLRTKPRIVASRIDFSLIAQGLTDSVKNIMYTAGIFF